MQFKNSELSNDNFVVKYCYVLPVNIIGIYSWVFHYPPEYIILYDNNNNYIGQSSPFCISSELDLNGGEHILPKYKHKPDEEFYISGGPCQHEYAIAVYNREWWNKILQYFH
ncbi:DUF6201 family protein [Xenorhabdus innexi]|uniref:DUF6201 family protein n=1 Tax=Xenorhabdus innexi TaxID=290109 RepID=UPI0011815B45